MIHTIVHRDDSSLCFRIDRGAIRISWNHGGDSVGDM